jgi:hypothetical protein
MKAGRLIAAEKSFHQENCGTRPFRPQKKIRNYERATKSTSNRIYRAPKGKKLEGTFLEKNYILKYQPKEK